MKDRERPPEAGTQDAPVVIIDSQDASPPSPSSPSPQPEPSQAPQMCQAVETSGTGAGQPSMETQSQGSSQSADCAQPAATESGEAGTAAPSGQKKKRRGRKPKNKEREENTQGKRKNKKAVSGVPQGTERLAEGSTVWQRLGVCKCDKCGFTADDQSIFQCHICSSKRSATSATPQACSSSAAASSSDSLAQATPSPLAFMHPPATSAAQSQPSSASENQGAASCSAAIMSASCKPPEDVIAKTSASEEPNSKPVSTKVAPLEESTASRQGVISFEPSTGQYTCKQCGFVDNGIEFIEHLMFQMISNPYYCQYCPKSFAERVSFHKHCASEHPNEKKKCKLRQVSLVRGVMNRAAEEGKPATFSFHGGFHGCVKKSITQRKTVLPACSQSLVVMPVAACYSNTATTCQMTTSTPPGATTTVSTALPSAISSTTSVAQDGVSAEANRDSHASALPQASEATVTGAVSQLDATCASHLSTSAHRPLCDASVLQSPVTCVSSPLVFTTASSNSTRVESRTLPDASFRPHGQSDSHSEVTEMVENSAAQDAECPMPVIIGYQGNYRDHPEDVPSADLSADNTNSNTGASSAHGPFIGIPVVSVQSSRATISNCMPLVTGPGHTPVTLPLTATTVSLRQIGAIQQSLLSSVRKQTAPQAATSPAALRPGSVPRTGLAQREQPRARSWHFHVPSSPDSPPRYRNTQVSPPIVMNLQRLMQERAQAASQRYPLPSVSQPATGLPRCFSVRGPSTVEGPFIQNHQFIPVLTNTAPAQSAFVRQSPPQGPTNIAVHPGQPQLHTVAGQPVLGPGVRLQLPHNIRLVSGPPAQSVVRVAGPGCWQPIRVVNLPSVAAPPHPLAAAGSSDNALLNSYSPISPPSASPGPVYTPISPVNTPASPSPSRVTTSIYTPISPARIPSSPVYIPVSPPATTSAGQYSPISPAPPDSSDSHSQPLDLSVTSQHAQSVPSLVPRLALESTAVSLTTATVSATAVGTVPGAVVNTSVEVVGAPTLFTMEPAAAISRVKQEEGGVTPREPSRSSTPSTPSVSSPVPQAAPSAASQPLASVEKYFIKYRDSYACLRCGKRFHDSEEFYQHVWSHQHTGGQCCSNCSDSVGPEQYRCTETERVVSSVSGMLMDRGLLSRLRDECREKLSRRLLQGEAGDGASQVVMDAAASSGGQLNTTSLPSCAGDARQDQDMSEQPSASSAQSSEVRQPSPTETVSGNQEREAEDPTLNTAANTDASEGQGREEAGPREVSSFEGNTPIALGTDGTSPRISARNANDKEDRNDDQDGRRSEPKAMRDAVEQEQPSAGLASSPTAGVQGSSQASTAGDQEAESPAREGEGGVQERGEEDGLSTESHQTAERTEAGVRNTQGDEESGGSEAVSGGATPVQEESSAGGDMERGEGSSDTGHAACQDQPPAALSQSDADSGSRESQEFVLSRDSTPDRSNEPLPPQREAPVFERSEVFFICTLCEFSCCLAIDFTMHLNSDHHDNTAFPCYHCNYQGKYTTDLTNHITAHTTGDSKIYSCPCASTLSCPFRTDSLKSLSNHLQCHPGHAFWCSKCNSEFEDDTELLLHLTSNSMTLYSCSQCPSRFLEKAAIQRHWQARHNGGLVFRVVKMLLCQERKDHAYSPPPCPLPIRRLSAEEEASGHQQDGPASRASTPGCGASSEPSPRHTPIVVGSVSGKKCRAPDPVSSSSEAEVACPEAMATSHPALESLPPSRPGEEDEASNPEADLCAGSECGAAVSLGEQPSTDSVNTPASHSLAVDTIQAVFDTGAEKPDSPAVSACRHHTNKSNKTSPLSISKEKVGKIRQLFSQIKLPVKVVVSAEGEEEEVSDLPACNCKSEDCKDLVPETTKHFEGRTCVPGDNSANSALTENELEEATSLDQTDGANSKVEGSQAVMKTEESVPERTTQGHAAVVRDEIPDIVPAPVEESETASHEKSETAPRGQAASSIELPAQPEDMVPLKKLLGTDELHKLLLNTLCHERSCKAGLQFICSICEIGFDKRELVHNHLFGHFRMPFITCALCPFGCSSRPEFVAHFGTAHPRQKKVCKYLMVPRSNPLRQLASDGPLTVEKFREFCHSFACGESSGVQNTSCLSSQNTMSLLSQNTLSQSLPQDENVTHSCVKERSKDPHVPAEEPNSVHDSPSSAETQVTEQTTAVTDGEKRGGVHSDEEHRMACSVKSLEVRRVSAGEAAKCGGPKEAGKCGVKSSISSMIPHRRSSGHGSRDISVEESATEPESASDEHARPAAQKPKKPASCESPARPKPGTYRMVKHGACSKPKCLACGSTTLSLSAMSQHLKTCPRYINSEHDSEHISKAGSLAKKMKTSNGGRVEGSASFTASDSVHTHSAGSLTKKRRTSHEICSQQGQSEGGASSPAWDPKDAAAAPRDKTVAKSPASSVKRKLPWNRPGPLSSKLASLQRYRLGAADKEGSLVELSGVKRQLNKDSGSRTMVSGKSTLDLDNTSSDMGDSERRDALKTDGQKDAGSTDSEPRSLQPNTCEPEKSAGWEPEEDKREKKKGRTKAKKSVRIIYSSNEEDDSDADVSESVTEMSVTTVSEPVTNVPETVTLVPQGEIETVTEEPETATEVSETATEVSETVSQVTVPKRRESGDTEELAESKEKSEQIFTCKYCDFCAPECQRLELESHLQKKHPHLLQLAKCGHCKHDYIYNSSKAGYLSNHTRKSHPGLEERKEDLPLDYFYHTKLKENLSPKPDHQERFPAKTKELPVKRKNTAKRTGPKVGTEEAELGAGESSSRKSSEMPAKASMSLGPQGEEAESGSTGARSGPAQPCNCVSLDMKESETSEKNSTVPPKPATLRVDNAERSIWSAVGLSESGIAATNKQAPRSASQAESSQGVTLASWTASKPHGTLGPEPATSSVGSVSRAKEVYTVEATVSSLGERKSQTVGKPHNATQSAGSAADTAVESPEQVSQKSVMDSRGTATPARPASSEDAVKKPSVKPQKSRKSSGEKAGASQTGSTLSEPGSKKPVLKPHNTPSAKVAGSQAASTTSSKESLLKPHNKASSAGPHPGTNKGSASQGSNSKQKNSAVRQKEQEGVGTETPASQSQSATRRRRISDTSSEDDSDFQASKLKRKRESCEETARRDAARAAKRTLQSQLGEGGESDASHSSDEDFCIEKHVQQAKHDRIRKLAFLSSDNTLRSSKKAMKRLKTGQTPGPVAGKSSDARPASSSGGSNVSAGTAVLQNGASAKPSSAQPPKPSASVGSSSGQQGSLRRTLGVAARAKNYGYICVLCDQRHMELKKIKAHLARHLDYRIIPCCCCSMEFMDVSEARQHHIVKHPDSTYSMTVSRDPKVEMKLNQLMEDCLQRAKEQAAGQGAQPSPLDSSLAGEKRQTVVWRQSIQCRQCQSLHDSINELKTHWEEQHEGSQGMEWVDVRSQGIYNLKGGLLKAGPNSLSLQHKYLCAFCPFRAIQRDLLTEHREQHPDISWQWTVTLQTAIPVTPGPSHPRPKTLRPAWARSAATSTSNASSPTTSDNPTSTQQRSRDGGVESAGAGQTQATERGMAQVDGGSGLRRTGLKLKRGRPRDPKLGRGKAMVLLKDLLNGSDQGEISRLCHSNGVTSIRFDRKDRGSKHKKLLEPGNTS